MQKKQRPIKFRIWSTTNNSMSPPADFFEWVKNVGINADNEESIKEVTNSWILMQYTGLKDKNGKEIYEGDIVKLQHGIYEVEFDCGAFLTKPQNIDDGPILFTRESLETLFSWQEPIKEVIGNIYENPELLCQKN